jgi:phage anti-repressor protein
MRSAGKAKLNADALHNMLALKDRYSKLIPTKPEPVKTVPKKGGND